MKLFSLNKCFSLLYLMPVRGVCVRVHLLREPLQVAGDVVFEPLAVADIVRERAAVTHQCVHPVLVDELCFKEHHVSYTTTTLHYIHAAAGPLYIKKHFLLLLLLILL